MQRKGHTQVLLRSPHTLPKKRFYGTGTFPSRDEDLFGMARRCTVTHTHIHTHTCSSGKNFRHWRGLKHLICLRWGTFKRRCIFPCFYPLNVTQMCHQSICLSLQKALIKGFLSNAVHDICFCHLCLHGLPLFPRKFLISAGSDCNKRITARPQDGGGPNLPSPPSACLSFLLSGWLPTVCRGFLPLCPRQLSHAWART